MDGDRPQEVGIHVHLYDGTERILDDTYGEIILGGRRLVREDLLAMMTESTVICHRGQRQVALLLLSAAS